LIEGSGIARKDIEDQFEFGINDKIWKSHAITIHSLRELKEGKLENFLQERKILIEQATNHLINRLAAWDQNDRPSLAYILSQGEIEE